eukprot:6817034-Pyramimonas_sp.AAC.2
MPKHMRLHSYITIQNKFCSRALNKPVVAHQEIITTAKHYISVRFGDHETIRRTSLEHIAQ